MILIILDNLYGVLGGGAHSIKVVIIHLEVHPLLFFLDLKMDKIGLSKGEEMGITTPLLISFSH